SLRHQCNHQGGNDDDKGVTSKDLSVFSLLRNKLFVVFWQILLVDILGQHRDNQSQNHQDQHENQNQNTEDDGQIFAWNSSAAINSSCFTPSRCCRRSRTLLVTMFHVGKKGIEIIVRQKLMRRHYCVTVFFEELRIISVTSAD